MRCPASAFFQRAKSWGLRFSCLTSTRAPSCISSKAAVGQFSVFRILADIEIDRSVDFISQPGLDHFFNRFQLFRNVAGGPGTNIRTDDAHPVHRLKMPGGVGFRNGHRFQFQFPGTLQHFVLTLVGVSHQVPDIGDVLDVKVESTVLQVAQDDVETDIGLGMAEVTVVVNRRSADIKRHPSLTRGTKSSFWSLRELWRRRLMENFNVKAFQASPTS